MKKVLSMLVLLSFIAASPLCAAEADATKWFFGAGYLQSEADTNISALTGTASLDEDDNGFKVFVGYQLNPYVGFELGYADLGTVTLTGNNGDTFLQNGVAYTFTANNVNIDWDTWTIDLGAKFSLPLEIVTRQEYLKYITPFAKLGGFYWDREATATASGLNRSTVSEDGFDLYFGAGLSINFHKNVAVTGEWQRYAGDGDTDTYGVNLIVKF